jgi:hypothetical protein
MTNAPLDTTSLPPPVGRLGAAIMEAATRIWGLPANDGPTRMAKAAAVYGNSSAKALLSAKAATVVAIIAKMAMMTLVARATEAQTRSLKGVTF